MKIFFLHSLIDKVSMSSSIKIFKEIFYKKFSLMVEIRKMGGENYKNRKKKAHSHIIFIIDHIFHWRAWYAQNLRDFLIPLSRHILKKSSSLFNVSIRWEEINRNKQASQLWPRTLRFWLPTVRWVVEEFYTEAQKKILSANYSQNSEVTHRWTWEIFFEPQTIIRLGGNYEHDMRD